MANTLTLTALITAVRQRSDTENSQFVTDAELTSYINQSYQELYDVLVQKYGNDYFVTTGTISTDGVNDHFSLPTDFQKLLGVDLVVSSTSSITIPPFMMASRNRFSVPNSQSFYGMTNLRYRLSGSTLWISPLPQTSQTLKVYYIPELAALASGSDTAVNLGGWLEYVIVDAAIKVMQKEESDVSALMAQKQALLTRIESAAEARDAGSPQTVQDSRSNDFWGGGEPNGGWGFN